jgi:quercetin dioxygenase-like cupin family protein
MAERAVDSWTFETKESGKKMLRLIVALVFTIQVTISFASAADIRRVVTGSDASDKSAAMFDSQVHLNDVQPDVSIGYLWVTHAFPVDVSKADAKGDAVGISPPDNGTQFGVVEFQPADPSNPPSPAWHRTRTVDYVVVVSGEIDLMLDQSVVHLKAGDAVVQQATNHAWVNRGKEICRLLFVVMDAKP